MRRAADLPIVVCIDVEPDARVFPPDRPSPWRGFERFVERAPELRARLAQATGAPVGLTWFVRMDPQIAAAWGSAGWPATRYRDELRALREAGDELGLHVHPWRWEGRWVADYADEDWSDECLTTGLDAYEAAFGVPCAAHRGGDHHLTARMLERLRGRSVAVDLTIEPGLPALPPPGGEPARGSCPDWRRAPTKPFRSSPAVFPSPRESEGGPVLVPLLSAPGRRMRRRTLSPEIRPALFAPRLAWALRADRASVAAVALRTAVVLGDRWPRVIANLERVARRPGTRFVTATSAVARLGAS